MKKLILGRNTLFSGQKREIIGIPMVTNAEK